MSSYTITLNTGHKMSIVGLGTWLAKPSEVQGVVKFAIDVGYRQIDTAFFYQNEKEIGLAIEAQIKENKVKREDLFIVGKLWNTFHDPPDVRPAIIKSLENLNLEYLDLFLIHVPVPFVNNGILFPRDENNQVLFADVDYVDTWKAMEKLVDEGLAKSIGVSNFNEYQINRILKECKVVPANNQIELHPYLPQGDLVEFCVSNGITVTAYCPFGGPGRPWAKQYEPLLMEDPKILIVAERLGRTPAQVLVKFHVQRGISVVPKSVTPSRIESNFQVFDFELGKEDMELIRSIDIVNRYYDLEDYSSNKYFPFRENYTE